MLLGGSDGGLTNRDHQGALAIGESANVGTRVLGRLFAVHFEILHLDQARDRGFLHGRPHWGRYFEQNFGGMFGKPNAAKSWRVVEG